jgi:hypothetical protein
VTPVPTEDELRERLRVAESRRQVLQAECVELAARLPDIRAVFGNPFYYSRPQHPDEGKAHYTGHRSHEVSLPTILELLSVEREIKRLKAELDTRGLQI